MDEPSQMGTELRPDLPQRGGVAVALMQALQQHPGGISAVLDSLRHNGLSGQVQNWAAGRQNTATPPQVQQGLQGTGLIESTAQRAGLSPESAVAAIAAILPALIRHFAPGGHAPQSDSDGPSDQFLSRML